MVRMAAVDNDHHHHRGAKFASPPSNSMSPAPPPPSSRTRLHDFSFPTLSWGTHRLLRCSKGGGNGPASSPPPSGPDTPSPDKEKPHRPEGGGVGGAGGSLQRRRASQQPWNLRTRRSATAAPARPARPEGADEEEAVPAPPPAAEVKKRGFAIALSKEEIAEDFVAIRGSRPPRRPKKRPRTVQRQLDLLYPGSCLADVTPGSYKIEEVTACQICIFVVVFLSRFPWFGSDSERRNFCVPAEVIGCFLGASYGRSFRML
ncbi:unnamed protein product [Urochloa decumbens]|uniref:Uncharacterized protein n=1 Tax=Urochloa decumbens TaxID=240449 RepID=A0ABC8ZQ23_9POAL